jgi:ribonucleoside-diphosphate reductase alpha chain
MKNSIYTREDALQKAQDYFNGDELAASVFITKYALQDRDGNFLESTPDEMHCRLAKEFARIEQKYPNPLSEKEIYEQFKNFKKIIPQGSPMSGIGNTNQIQSISNCFVIESPQDSYGGILLTDQELVQIAKRRGGIGFDVSTLRPKGEITANAARTTDGIEVFMERFSNSTREVAQGGRRGALMLTISVHHPQIRDFIKIKRDLTKVTGANISIRLSDEFMKAVKNKEEVQLRWPIDSNDPQVTEIVNAEALWEDIIESAHASAEPGLLFWDTATKMTPSDIYAEDGFGSTSTNPCGEIILSPYDSCRLMVVNLISFVKKRFTKSAFFDFKDFGDAVQKAQRLMDDMIDIEIEQIDKILAKIDSDPESDHVKAIEKDLWLKIKNTAILGRRTGLGITALGDTMASLNLTYGSDESVEMTEAIYKALAVNSYRSSCNLAKERGSFPVYDQSKEENHPFLKRIWDAAPDVYEMSKKYGRRNIANTTTAPAGSVSTLTQTSSGIEPVFMLHYKRRKKIMGDDARASVDFVDESGDRWEEYDVYHHGFKNWINSKGHQRAEIDNEKLVSMSPYSGATAQEIDWIAKVKMQAAAQKWICHAISNTTNLPADIDVETVKQVYMTGWELGCKGVTVYREGSRAGVLVSAEEPSLENENNSSAAKRPELLDSEIHRVSIKGEDWTILVGLKDNQPYEIFGGLSEYVEIPKKYGEAQIRKRPRKTMPSKYDLIIGKNGDSFVVKDIVKVFDNPNYGAFTRTLSLALRHRVPIQYVVEQLQKDKNADLFSFSRVIARCLKKYILDGTKVSNGVFDVDCCDSPNVIYQEGCATCINCGMAKCG